MSDRRAAIADPGTGHSVEFVAHSPQLRADGPAPADFGGCAPRRDGLDTGTGPRETGPSCPDFLEVEQRDRFCRGHLHGS